MFEFTKTQEMLRDMVREFADTELAPRALELDKKAEFSYDIVKKLGQQGLIGITMPKEFGGADMGYLACTIAIEELGRVYPSIAFYLETLQACLECISFFGTEDQKKKYLPPLLKGEKVACIAATEPTGGSALANLSTEAVPDGDGYRINGRKVYITSGGVSDYCIVLAKTGERGASFFLVEKDNPGFIVSRRQDQMGFKGIHVSELAFNDCKVPKENLIGKEGKGLNMAVEAFTIARFYVGAVGLGLARGAFEIALKYSKERILYGKPISNLQAIQFMLVDMDTAIDAARWLIYYPGAALDKGARPKDIAKYSARAKAIGSKTALNVTQKAIQILGGDGVSPEFHLPRLLPDAMELFPATGTLQIMKVIQAAQLLR